MKVPKTTHELRCFCRRSPILALYGVTSKGNLYVEMKVYKQRNVYGWIVVELSGGTIQLHCRECHRWHNVIVKIDILKKIESAALQVSEAPEPEEVLDTENPQCLRAGQSTE